MLVPVRRPRRVLARDSRSPLLLLVVLGFLILSYRQTIKAYPTAGGAYIVTRDNFGLLPAQVAGVALLTDYVLTVSVSVAAGTAALASAFPGARAVQPAGSRSCSSCSSRSGTCAASEGVGTALRRPHLLLHRQHGRAARRRASCKMFAGDLPRAEPRASRACVPVGGTAATALFYGATRLRRAARLRSGGAAVTGVEAISNGVPAFRSRRGRTPARRSSSWGRCSASCSSACRSWPRRCTPRPTTTAPRRSSPRSASSSTAASAARATCSSTALQAGTMLILVLAANTSFADFPRLA